MSCQAQSGFKSPIGVFRRLKRNPNSLRWFYRYFGSTPWWACVDFSDEMERDRTTKQVRGWTLEDRGTATARLLDAPLPHAPHINLRHRLLAPLRPELRPPAPLLGQGPHLHHRKSQQPPSRRSGPVTPQKPIAPPKNSPTSPPASSSISSISSTNSNQYLVRSPRT